MLEKLIHPVALPLPKKHDWDSMHSVACFALYIMHYEIYAHKNAFSIRATDWKRLNGGKWERGDIASAGTQASDITGVTVYCSFYLGSLMLGHGTW